MRSRTVRLSVSILSWMAIGIAAFLLVRSDKQLTNLRADERQFDRTALEAIDLLANLRLAQQSYIAEGQAVGQWAPKVAEGTSAVSNTVASLQRSATTTSAQSALEQAAATLVEFARVDKRAQDYLESEQRLMAGDVIFTEGGQAAIDAARSVQVARVAQSEALDASEALIRRQQMTALASAAGVVVVVTLLLGLTKIPEAAEPENLAERSEPLTPAAAAVAAPLPANPPAADTSPLEPPVLPALKAAAAICTEFGCVRDAADVQMLLARAAEAMDATGLVVWLGTPSGADLQPVLTHGYSEEIRKRLPNVPRGADNAAAAAYRSGEIQLVRPQPGASSRLTAAIVAPMLSAYGCIGALSIELKRGADLSDSVQALASIMAAQLAGVLAPASSERPSARAASL